MKRLCYWLAGLGALQLVLVAAVYWPDREAGQELPTETMLPFDPDRIAEIHIGDDRDNEAILLKNQGRWLLPTLADMPVDPDMIEALFDGIARQALGWPVATTVAARQRFQVASYHYQRRLTLIGDGELLGTLYLGTSPGFRTVHARNDSQDAIYSIGFNVFDAPAKGAGWLDKALLQTHKPVRVIGDDFTVTRFGKAWLTPSDIPAGQLELLALLDGLKHLRVDGIAGDDLQRSLSELSPDFTLAVTGDEGVHELAFFTLEERHYVYSSRFRISFSLSAYDYDRLASIDSQRLMAAPTPEATVDDNILEAKD